MFTLTARLREDNQYYDLATFDDLRQFDYYIDQVDQELYSEAMILENTYPMPTLKKYVEFRPLSRRR